jgi:hypothetical protein
MKLLKILVTFLVILVFPIASSMDPAKPDPIKETVEIIKRCHTKGALSYRFAIALFKRPFSSFKRFNSLA